MTKTEKIVALRESWKDCTLCPLHERRVSSDKHHIVFGHGDLSADLLFVGEGPGINEERSGAPFIGEAGGCLNGILKSLSVDRMDVFITNTVSCRACDVIGTGREQRVFNKAPSNKQIATCNPRLYEEIYIVDPLLIVTLGREALRAMTRAKSKLAPVLGEVLTVTIPGHTKVLKEIRHKRKVVTEEVPVDIRYPCLATYHPSYILQNGGFDDLTPDGPAQKLLEHLTLAVGLVKQFHQIEGRSYK